jgi:hypothetical protein
VWVGAPRAGRPANGGIQPGEGVGRWRVVRPSRMAPHSRGEGALPRLGGRRTEQGSPAEESPFLGGLAPFRLGVGV